MDIQEWQDKAEKWAQHAPLTPADLDKQSKAYVRQLLARAYIEGATAGMARAQEIMQART